jgi:hypothetical protein
MYSASVCTAPKLLEIWGKAGEFLEFDFKSLKSKRED